MPVDHVVVTRRIPEAGMRMLQDAGARVTIVEPDDEAIVDRAALVGAMRDADVLLSLLTERIDAEVMDAAPRLRGIANMAVGYNNIDIAAARARGIPVSNTPGVLTDATADLTFALLLAVARRIPEAHAYMTAGRYRIWGPQLLLGAEVHGRTLGIIGYGRIGRAVAQRARGFGMRILAFSPSSRAEIEASRDVAWADFDALIRDADFVTLHARMTPETHHMIGERELRMMKPTSYLINVARGEMVEEPALVRALQEGWIAGAALDVYEHEPAMAEGLAACANAVLVPHIGSATVATRDLMATMAATNAMAMLRCVRPPNAVVG